MTNLLTYGATAKWLHWLVGIIVLTMLIFGRTLEALPPSEREKMIMVHSGLGTLVLLLMLIRWGWRLSHKPPASVSTMGTWQTRLSKWTHWAFYVLLIVQPVLGVSQAMFITEYSVVAFGAIDYSAWASADLKNAQLLHILHSLNAWVLSALIIVHIAAAFYHHYIQKDSALRRMLPFGKVEAPP